MLSPSPNHGTQWLPNDDDDDWGVKVVFDYTAVITACILVPDPVVVEIRTVRYLSEYNCCLIRKHSLA